MDERRFQNRLMCADLVDVEWYDNKGRRHGAVANLEDISSAGACLQTETEIPLDCVLRIVYPGGEIEGRVRYCVFRDIGYFVGVQFDDGTNWDPDNFEPLHLFDPQGLVPARAGRVGKR